MTEEAAERVATLPEDDDPLAYEGGEADPPEDAGIAPNDPPEVDE